MPLRCFGAARSPAPWAELPWPCCCLPADSKGRTAFMRHILGVTDEERQQRRCVGRLEGITCFLVVYESRKAAAARGDRASLSPASCCTAPETLRGWHCQRGTEVCTVNRLLRTAGTRFWAPP